MEANVLPLRPRTGRGPDVHVDGEVVTIEHLTFTEPALAAFLGDRPADERPVIVERALRIGLTALQDAGVTVNVDVVRREFETLVSRTTIANERAVAALDALLRQNFADGDGRLPRTLERFLGDRGALRAFVNELFDETRRDSAIGRMQMLLGRYFDGDASRLAQLLDPTRMGSPLHQFRSEVTDGFAKLHERLAALEAAAAARGAERARSAAKGGDFEGLVATILADVARGAGDLLDRTALDAGSVLRSKKGDFVLTLDPGTTRGSDVKVVIECKDRPMSARAIREELREARENRGAAVAIVVFTAQHAPPGVDPFTLLGEDVYCVLDPDAPEPAYLEAAVRLARMLALATVRDAAAEVDSAAISAALCGIREQVEQIRGMKSQLTSIGNATRSVWSALDRLKESVLARVAEVESELQVVKPR